MLMGDYLDTYMRMRRDVCIEERYNCTSAKKWWMKRNFVIDGKVGGWVGYVGGGHCTVHSLGGGLSPSSYSLVIRDENLDPSSFLQFLTSHNKTPR